MIIKNAAVYGADFTPCAADIEIANGIIKNIGKTEADGLDFSGCVALPGFIDIHIHGCNMADATDGNNDSAAKMSKWLVTKGVTSFCPTTMTLPVEMLEKCFGYIADTMGKEEGAYIHGINMEGPFIAPEKKGAQDAAHILSPDYDVFSKLNSICPVKLVDIAPEQNGAEDFIREATKVCTVSAAHTTANYEQGKKAIALGVSHATHLYNAMNGLTSREAGMVGAVLDSEAVTAELICDGFHNHPAVVRMAFRQLGENRVCVISDSMSAADNGDGEYELGGQTVYVKDGKATLADGTIAASTTNVFDEFKNLLKFGIDFRSALKACTANPAKAIGVYSVTGSIEAGKRADLTVIDGDTQLRHVFVKGRQIF